MKDMDGKPMLSVIVPCYNMERYLRRALDSLIANDYPDRQVILIDDGSTDGTLANCVSMPQIITSSRS